MPLSSANRATLLAGIILACSALSGAQAPNLPPKATPPQTNVANEPPQDVQPSAKPQVVFSGSAGQPAAPAENAHPLSSADPVSVTVTDTDRAALVFTAYDLDVHLDTADRSLAVEARITLHNTSPAPLSALPLQLSSTFHMERVSLAGTPLPLARHSLASDADHSGQLEETIVTLPQPLAPDASLSLAIAYSGRIQAEPTAQPGTTAAEPQDSLDWDRVSDEFTGLRGFGNVVWYPVSSLPAMLGEGAKLFAEINRQRALGQAATIAIRVTQEFSGAPPNIAVLAGHLVDAAPPALAPSGSFQGVQRFTLPTTRLGFRIPSLFIARRVTSPSVDSLRVYSTGAHAGAVQGYLDAAALVEPLLSTWLAPRPQAELSVIDLPINGAPPSLQGDAVIASLVPAQPSEIAPLLSQALSHSRFRSPRVWLDEGVPALISVLYTEQTRGGTAALEQLASSRAALAFIEPASPGAGAGQDLLHATDPVYYRAKALDVLWMLRDLAGDKALQTALHAYDPAADTDQTYFEKLIEQASGRDLKWFFDAWVYQDLGLPDLAIADVFPSSTGQADQWLVTVDLLNQGYAETEVPVTVHSASTAVTERVRIPARGRVSRRMLISGEPTQVEVNDGTVPEVAASLHQRALVSR